MQGRSTAPGLVERDEGFEIRFVTFNELKLSLSKVFGSAANAIIYDSGIEPGRRSCRRIMASTSTVGEALDLLAERKADENWGRLSFSRLDFDRCAGKVIVDDSLESRDVRMEEPSCHFLRGYLQGFLSELFHRGVVVEEVRCKAKGDARCEFAVAGV